MAEEEIVEHRPVDDPELRDGLDGDAREPGAVGPALPSAQLPHLGRGGLPEGVTHADDVEGAESVGEHGQTGPAGAEHRSLLEHRHLCSRALQPDRRAWWDRWGT